MTMAMTAVSDDRLATLLGRFPGPLTLYPSRRKWLSVIATSIVFVALAVWMLNDAAGTSGTGLGGMLERGLVSIGVARDTLQASVELAWATLAFFALCGTVGVVNLLPGAAGMTLDREGFVTRNLFRRHAYKWTDVSEFAGVRLASVSKFVGFNDRSAAASRVARTNAKLVGRNSTLPETYGFSGDDLARFMSLWRERALSK